MTNYGPVGRPPTPAFGGHSPPCKRSEEQESFFTKKSELKKVVLSVLSHKPNNNTKFVPKPGFVKPFFFPQNDFGFAIQAAPREDRTYMIQASRQHK